MHSTDAEFYAFVLAISAYIAWAAYYLATI